MGEQLKRYRPSECVVYHPNLPADMRLTMEATLAELDQIHWLPKLVHVRIASNRRRTEQGCYFLRSALIEVSRHAVDGPGTLVHEFGHFVDNRILHPLSNEFASNYEPELDELLALCFGTRLVQNLALLGSRRRFLAAGEAAFLRESLKPSEVFARAYHQWVCSKGSGPILRGSMSCRKTYVPVIAGRPCPLEWDPDEFADIMSGIDRLFERKGLL